jgi:hypothetical protein
VGLKTYTLHLPDSASPGDALPLERAEVVRDGFSWGAFLFTFLWCFWHRLWIAGLLVLLAVVGLGFGLRALGVSPGATTLAEFLLMFLIGLEASSLRRWTLGRRGRPAVTAVAAGSTTEAETKSFARWLERSREAQAPISPHIPVAQRAAEPIIGLFPEAERRR